ncbi:dynein light chain 2, cytoplasmic [Lates japonicus]|uniref:Dynein light chain n=1 Tax=Lates japonicus TaxID=270547 RepID=A0AAD3NFI5_LATJO|nr:dynein light chain 2, cytoplasmic [Lates japonicus]GLD70790.1 dynein light chain 2, cytoplasmic [Lates japonicus]
MPADRSWRKTLATRGEAAAQPMAGCSMQQRGGELAGESTAESQPTYMLIAAEEKQASSSSSTMTDRKAVIKNADMSEDMQQDAVDCATQAMEKYNIEKDIAAYIKKEFDKKYNPTWHCIVGRNFGSYVTHETKHFIYFYLGQVAILLFKSG